MILATATGDWLLPGYFSFLLPPKSLAFASPAPYNQVCDARGEMCLWLARGYAAYLNGSLTIRDLERKCADLRLENPVKSHRQTSYRGTEREYDLY